jgi:hypothetical protein
MTTRIAEAAILLLLNGVFTPVLAGDITPADKRSGYAFMSRDTQAMQDDDTARRYGTRRLVAPPSPAPIATMMRWRA